MEAVQKMFRGFKSAMQRVWLQLREPRVQTIVMLLVYLIIALQSFADVTLAELFSSTPETQMYIEYIVFGGGVFAIVGMISLWTTITWLEKGAIYLLWAALFSHTVYLVADPATIPESKLTIVFLTVIYGLVLLLRYIDILMHERNPLLEKAGGSPWNHRR